ncbi:MAG: hypothetical protein ABS78_01605 [Phenylobacterium sp. SCN 70-31]|nr:MAG: hypothetical protein ABS78_01605 [Phenylobacterium sp. SCN 70-31]
MGRSLIDQALDDTRHGWSVGTFGAIGEFMRDTDEAVDDRRAGAARTLITTRAAGPARPAPVRSAVRRAPREPTHRPDHRLAPSGRPRRPPGL